MPTLPDSGSPARDSPRGDGETRAGFGPASGLREMLLGKLVVLLAHATTEELAEVVADLSGRVGARGAEGVPAEPVEPGPAERGLAAKVLGLLTALDPARRLRKAPPIKVFNLYYRQGLEPAEIARRCGCHRSLIFDRLAAIQRQLPWTPQRLRQLSPQVEAMEDAVRDSRASGIYRKGAAYGDEEGDARGD